MKARLIKKSKHFKLISKDDNGEEFVIATSSDYAIKALSGLKNPITDETVQIKKLSIENCQAIELGYDLDELAREKYGNSLHHATSRASFKSGFQKCLEILGDKKFSEEDIKRAMDVTLNYEIKRDAKSFQEKIDFLKSLQQTEWNVEVVTEYKGECSGNNNDGCFMDSPGHDYGGCYKRIPKLDSEGCLILKRV